jgi:uncharacterized membrane protein YdjX (TVP38/TMEM64 family)
MNNNNQPEAKTKKKGLWRPILLLMVIVAVLVLAKVFGVGERLGELRAWIESLGAWGYFVFIMIYIVAVVAALPGSALTLASGVLFGSFFGVIVVSVASTVGAGLSFLIGRYFARDAIGHWLEGKEKFRRLDQLTEDHGAIIVALTRLVPIFPFNLLNYGFGLTRVRFWTYLFWSWLCMLPGTILYVVVGDAATKGIAQGRVPWHLIGVGVLIAAILFVLVRQARRKLKEKEGNLENRDTPDDGGLENA